MRSFIASPHEKCRNFSKLESGKWQPWGAAHHAFSQSHVSKVCLKFKERAEKFPD